MKTLDEIKKITNQAIAEKERQAAETMAKLLLEERRRKQGTIRMAKDVSFFVEKIEEQAKQGKREYSIGIGASKESHVRLKRKWIKKLLKDFSPTFTEKDDCSFETNWEGGRIDGTERYFKSLVVHFSW